MLIDKVFRSRGLVTGVLAAFILLVMPIGEFARAQAPAAQGGALVGFVYAQDLKTPVAGAVVKLRNIANQKEFASGSTDANGMYKIDGVDEGRYILGVTAPKGDFNFDYVMLLKGGGMAKLSVALAPGGQITGTDAGKKSFFKSPVGIITMVVVVGAVLFAIFSEGETSPIR